MKLNEATLQEQALQDARDLWHLCRTIVNDAYVANDHSRIMALLKLRTNRLETSLEMIDMGAK